MIRTPAFKVAVAVVAVVAVVSILHSRTSKPMPGSIAPSHVGPNGMARNELTVGFLPVTCHLTCPVTDYASKHTTTGTNFNSLRFTEFPPIADALKTKQLQATFMIVPLAMKLREQGVPVKICYLGHRDGSTFVVRKASTAKSIRDLKGKSIGIPSIYSNQNLLLHKLMADNGMHEGDIKFIVIPPPDMPTALASGGIEGYFVGEPHAAKAEVDGTGRVLYNSYDIDPHFVSCALVVHEDLINQHPEIVKDLVANIAASGKWADSHRTEAAHIAAPLFKQKEALLRYVLTQPGRVSYSNLTPTDEDMNKIEDLAIQQKILKTKVPLTDILDRDFIPTTIPDSKIEVAKG